MTSKQQAWKKLKKNMRNIEAATIEPRNSNTGDEMTYHML
jgi:hypothetical protein